MNSFLKQHWPAIVAIWIVSTILTFIGITDDGKPAPTKPTDPELQLLDEAQAKVREAFAAYDWGGTPAIALKQAEAEHRCYEEINKRRLARIQELTRAEANTAALKATFEGLKALLKRPSRFDDLNEAEERLMEAFDRPLHQEVTVNSGEELPALTYSRCVAEIHKKRMERIK